MYPYLKENVVIVEGMKSDGIYDLNQGKFHRVNKQASNLLGTLNGEIAIDVFSASERIFIENAISKGIVVRQNESILHKKTELADVVRNDRPIRFAWIELTSICNQNCKHCFMGKDLNKTKPLKKELIYQLVDVLYERGITQIILTGGEPTLHPDFGEILDYVAQYDINITLLTNGTTSNIGQYIYKLKEYGVRTKMSILGWEKAHDYMVGVQGAFKKLLETIDLFIETKTPIELGMTICSANCMDAKLVREYANSKRLSLNMSPLYPIGRALDNYSLLYKHTQREFIQLCQEDKERAIKDVLEFPKSVRKTRPISPTDYEAIDLAGFLTNSYECGQKIIAILANGKVAPCLLLREQTFQIGDVFKEKLDDILQYDNPTRKEYNERMLLSNNAQCSNCEALYACKGGGCIAITQAIKGNINERNPYFSKCYYSTVLNNE